MFEKFTVSVSNSLTVCYYIGLLFPLQNCSRFTSKLTLTRPYLCFSCIIAFWIYFVLGPHLALLRDYSYVCTQDHSWQYQGLNKGQPHAGKAIYLPMHYPSSPCSGDFQNIRLKLQIYFIGLYVTNLHITENLQRSFHSSTIYQINWGRIISTQIKIYRNNIKSWNEKR